MPPDQPRVAARPPSIILGSSSPFRKALLQRLNLSFSCCSPEIDETRRPGEPPADFVTRLAAEKAQAVAEKNREALIIGSDQAACIGTEVLGKPGSRERALEQLSAASGRRVTFYTGLCLLNSASGNRQLICEPFHVHFRVLEQPQIERYLDAEQPYNCAGSFKSEGLGISLFRRLEGEDPNALIGLPLIRLVDMLAAEGIRIP